MTCAHIQRHEEYCKNYRLAVTGLVQCLDCQVAEHESTINLKQLQEDHRKWVNHNFPDQISHHGLLGLVEEVGELSHAHLKMEQGIRGNQEWAREDAIGDILIYLASYCNTNKIDLNKCVVNAWHEVSQRDWIKYPTNGVSS